MENHVNENYERIYVFAWKLSIDNIVDEIANRRHTAPDHNHMLHSLS